MTRDAGMSDDDYVAMIEADITYDDHAAEVARLRERIAELEAQGGDVDHACRMLRDAMVAAGAYEFSITAHGKVTIARIGSGWSWGNLDDPERLPSRELGVRR